MCIPSRIVLFSGQSSPGKYPQVVKLDFASSNTFIDITPNNANIVMCCSETSLYTCLSANKISIHNLYNDFLLLFFLNLFSVNDTVFDLRSTYFNSLLVKRDYERSSELTITLLVKESKRIWCVSLGLYNICRCV